MIDHSVSRVVERRLAFGKEDKEELRTLWKSKDWFQTRHATHTRRLKPALLTPTPGEPGSLSLLMAEMTSWHFTQFTS